MGKILVILLTVCGGVILFDTTYTYTDICSECVECNDEESYACCKSCIPRDKNNLKSQGGILSNSDIHECSGCTVSSNYVDDEGSNEYCKDDCNVVCEKCTACDSIYVCFERFFSPQTRRYTDFSKKVVSSDSPLAYVGSALGGVVFGSIVTSFVCVYLRRRTHADGKRVRKQEAGVHQIRNNTHCLSKPLEQGHGNIGNEMYCEIEDKKRHSKDLFHKTLTLRKSQTIDDTNDGVYSHLNETDRDAADRNEYYDHMKAKAMQGSSINVPTSSHGCGTVTVDSDGNVKHSEDGESIDDVKSSEKAEADEYFVLEKVH